MRLSLFHGRVSTLDCFYRGIPISTKDWGFASWKTRQKEES
jgi:hypothetical protein